MFNLKEFYSYSFTSMVGEIGGWTGTLLGFRYTCNLTETENLLRGAVSVVPSLHLQPKEAPKRGKETNKIKSMIYNTS